MQSDCHRAKALARWRVAISSSARRFASTRTLEYRDSIARETVVRRS